MSSGFETKIYKWVFILQYGHTHLRLILQKIGVCQVCLTFWSHCNIVRGISVTNWLLFFPHYRMWQNGQKNRKTMVMAIGPPENSLRVCRLVYTDFLIFNLKVSFRHSSSRHKRRVRRVKHLKLDHFKTFKLCQNV